MAKIIKAPRKVWVEQLEELGLTVKTYDGEVEDTSRAKKYDPDLVLSRRTASFHRLMPDEVAELNGL